MTKRVVVQHLPKTAGTSFLKIMRDWYGINHVKHTNKPTEDDYCQADVVYGHFPYDENYFDYRWITFVRHPIDRLSSFYYYTRERGQKSKRNYWWNLIKDMTLEQWLRCDESKNHIVKAFAGKTPHDKLEPIDITKAYENARFFFFIGFQERFSEDVKTLARLLEKPKPKMVHYLKSSNPGLLNGNLYGNNIDFEFYNYLLEIKS